MNPLRAIRDFGQSVWLDDIGRSMLENGELQRLIDEDGLGGITSNPSIFRQAIVETGDYRSELDALRRRGLAGREIVETLMVQDVGRAADLFRPGFEASYGGEGFVSIEVSPLLAHDAEGTIGEARRLWAALARPNVLIKVPGTREGLTAIRRLIAEGINVNVTLLFDLDRYAAVADAYLDGLEQRVADGQPVDGIRSVASFFLSRIDTLVDRRIDAIDTPAARALRGQAAIASAKLAYRHFLELTAGARWRELARRGAAAQPLLWASVGTKDPAYADTKYVDALVGPETVVTLPRETLDAYRDHGRPEARLANDMEGAAAVGAGLAGIGIDLHAAAARLEEEGVGKFVSAYDQLVAAVSAAPSPAATGK